MDEVKFVKDNLEKIEVIWSASRPYHFKFFKGCLPQILLRPFLDTVSSILAVAMTGLTNVSSKYIQEQYREIRVDRIMRCVGFRGYYTVKLEVTPGRKFY